MHSDPFHFRNHNSRNLSPGLQTRTLMAPLTALLFVAGLMSSGCVIHDHGHGSRHSKGGVKVEPRVVVATPVPVTFTFTKHHRHTVRDYYHQHPHHHGKKHKWKHKHKHKRNSHLSSRMQMQVIPVGLVRQLPPAPRGTQFIYHRDQVLLVDVNTRVVIDFVNIPVSVEYHEPVPAPIAFTFTKHDRHAVQDYYYYHPPKHGKKHKKKHKWKNKGKGHGKNHLPPGLAKRDVLPPGLQMQGVPVELVRELPPAPRGTQFIYHSDQVLLVEVSTRVVIDFVNITISAEY